MCANFCVTTTFDSPVQNSATGAKNTGVEFNNGCSVTIPSNEMSIFTTFSFCKDSPQIPVFEVWFHGIRKALLIHPIQVYLISIRTMLDQ